MLLGLFQIAGMSNPRWCALGRGVGGVVEGIISDQHLACAGTLRA